MKLAKKSRNKSALIVALSLLLTFISLGINPPAAQALDPCTPKYGVTEENGHYFAVRYFLDSCTWQVPAGVTSVDVLVVGGGGGGGADAGGGGGGGGGALVTGLAVSGNVDITIGAGGVGGSWGDPNFATKVGGDGGDSSVAVGAELVIGRGGDGGNGCNFLGAGYCSQDVLDENNFIVGTAGNNGGLGGSGDVSTENLAGGKGGDGVWYQPNLAPTSGSDGFQTTILGSTTYFGGGGGGSGANAQPGAAGLGGGANGITGPGVPLDPEANTGGGGGGGNGYSGGDGASGIVIIRYSLDSATQPFVVDVRADHDGTYLFAQQVELEVEFNESIQVVGNPILRLATGSLPKFATFDYVDGKSAFFSYTVNYSDSTPLLTYETRTSLNLNGGQIKSLVSPSVVANLGLPDPGYVGSLSDNSAVEIWLPSATSLPPSPVALARPVLSDVPSFNSQPGTIRRFVVKQEGVDGTPQTSATSNILCSVDSAEFDSCGTVFNLTQNHLVNPGNVCDESGVKDFGHDACNDDRYFIFEVDLPENVSIDLAVMSLAGGGVTPSSNHIQLVTDTIGPSVQWRSPANASETTNTRLRPTWTATDANSVSNSGTAIRQVTNLENGTCSSSWTDAGTQANSATITGSSNHCYRWTLDPSVSAQASRPTDGYGNPATENLTSPVIKIIASNSEQQSPRQTSGTSNVPAKPLQSIVIPASISKNKSFTVAAKSAQGIQTYVMATGACKAKTTTKTVKTKVGAKTIKSKVVVSYKITAGKAPGTCSVQTYNNGDSTYAAFNKTTQVAVTP